MQREPANGWESSHIPFFDFGGEGPLVHFAHSNGYPPACFRQFIAPFLDDYRVLAVCHRPLWPASQPEELNSWHLVADDMIRFFDQRRLQGVIGIGHSLGAVATMMAAIKRPELFRCLVLIEPIFLIPAILERLAKESPAVIEDKFPLIKIARSRTDHWPDEQAAFMHFRPKRVFARWSDESLRDYIYHGTYQDESGEIRLTYSPGWEAHIYTLAPTDVWELIPQVIQPTLAIRGARTDALAPAAWELWQMAQPEATFIEVPAAGHLLTMEKPREVAEIVLRFLKSLSLEEGVRETWLLYLRFDDQGQARTMHVTSPEKECAQEVLSLAERHGFTPTARLVEYALYHCSGAVKVKDAPSSHGYTADEFHKLWLQGDTEGGLFDGD